MSTRITTLFEDEANTNALYPRTKASAVSDDDGNVLGNMATYNMTDVASGVDQLHVGIDMELLWTNSSPTSAFAAQTVALDLSDYSLFLLIYKGYHTNDVYFSYLGTINMSARLSCMTDISRFRDITVTSGGIQFGTAKKYTTYGGASTDDNDHIVPYKIYGVR